MERYEEALPDLSRAIRLNPRDARALASRGNAYQMVERYDEALADFSRAIGLNPGYAWALAQPR